MVRMTLLVPIAAAALTQSASAQQVVSGTVIDEGAQTPVPDALVYIDIGADGARAAGVLTDANGRFRIAVGDRDEVILTLTAFGYQETKAFFPLPTDGPVEISMSLEPIQLEGFEARVDRVVQFMENRVKSLATFNSRIATREDLRDFDQTADIDWFLPSMNVAVGTGCEDCFMMSGRFKARFFVDDFEVSGGEFRSYRVGEICRVEVVRKVLSSQGGFHAYTCGFMEKVTRGEAHLAPLIPGWWPGGGQD